MTPSTALTWIIVVLALVGLLVYFSYRYMMKDLEKKRKAFKPSVIVIKEGLCYELPEDPFSQKYLYTNMYKPQIFTSYDQAITILEMVKETYPDAYLKEI